MHPNTFAMKRLELGEEGRPRRQNKHIRYFIDHPPFPTQIIRRRRGG